MGREWPSTEPMPEAMIFMGVKPACTISARSRVGDVKDWRLQLCGH